MLVVGKHEFTSSKRGFANYSSRAGPTLTGFKLVKALRIYSNTNTTRLKRYNRKICIFSMVKTTRASLLSPSKFVLPKDIVVTAHPEKRTVEQKCTSAH